MHFPSAAAFALTATSLISSTSALPFDKTGNVCTVKPTLLKYISKTGPLTRITSGDKRGGWIPLGHAEFIIASDPDSTGGSPSDTVRTAMKFDIPTGATGCRLHVSNPPTRTFVQGGQIDTDIFRVQDVRATNEWTCQPEPLPAQPNKVAQWGWEGGETNLWSGDYESSLSFLFKYGDWQTEGGVLHFLQAMDGNDSKDGFTIVYDC